MRNLTEDQVLLRGTKCTIAYAITRNGKMPAQDFLECKGKPRENPDQRDSAGLKHLFQLLSANGQIRNTEQFKKEQNHIWAFKKNQVRIAAFKVNDMWFLTHGFKKKRSKWLPKELDKADRIRQECIEYMEITDE